MPKQPDDAITIPPHPIIEVVRKYCEYLARASQSTGHQKNTEEKI